MKRFPSKLTSLLHQEKVFNHAQMKNQSTLQKGAHPQGHEETQDKDA